TLKCCARLDSRKCEESYATKSHHGPTLRPGTPRNLQLGRGARRGATRLALFVMSVFMADYVLAAHHVKSLGGEVVLFLTAAGFSTLMAGTIWVIYIAVEPFVRRRFPQILVSWARLLSGAWNDPLVGRDVLIGSGWGALVTCLL